MLVQGHSVSGSPNPSHGRTGLFVGQRPIPPHEPVCPGAVLGRRPDRKAEAA